MKFLITAGHGGSNPGAIYHGVTERELMTRLRDITAVKLRAHGHTVLTDGVPGVNLPLVKALALVPLCDIAVELHTNAFTNPSARGVEVVSIVSKRTLSQKIAQAIAKVLDSPLRGQQGWIPQEKTAHGSLGYVRAGGLIVETFFLSNLADFTAYQNNYWLVAQAIADVLHEQSK